MTVADAFAREHVAAFNATVAGRTFDGFLAGFSDDALVRFENVPGAGTTTVVFG